MTITEFLLARIAEDEAEARTEGLAGVAAAREPVAFDFDDTRALIVSPARVLAECEAKRRIVQEHADDHACVRYHHPDDNRDCYTVRALAAVYADHPDYDDAWRP